MNSKSRVALVRGKDRSGNVANALNLIADDVYVADCERIFLKPNFVSARNQLSATHVDAVRATLEFLRERTTRPITIGENATLGGTDEGYDSYGFRELKKRYGVELVDLSQEEYATVHAYDRDFHTLKLSVSKRVLESDFRISVGPPKTHDLVIVTLSLKNMVVGSLKMKSDIHQGYPGTNLNLQKMAQIIAPHLSVIDGFVGMEGDGPVSGTAVELKVAVASTDFLAADSLMARIMGFDPDEIGYMHFCNKTGLGNADLNNLEVVGQTLESIPKRPFKPHHAYHRQLDWQNAHVDRHLA